MYPNLKLQLWKSGIRQNRLARMVGVDETVLSRIVNGFRAPHEELQHSIAAVLKCDASWLFSQQDDAELSLAADPNSMPASIAEDSTAFAMEHRAAKAE